MSQHLIDTGRNGSAPSGDDRSTGLRHNGATEHDRAREGNGAAGAGHAAAHEDRQDDPRTGSSGDATLRAIDALLGALEQMSRDEHLLEQRLKDVHQQRSAGRSWHEILAEEDPPGTMQLVSGILACLAKASGTLRKELVDSLRREGVSIPAIARLFGVTHQRVSNLLRRPSE